MSHEHRHPKDRIPQAWQQFIDAVMYGDLNTTCETCRTISWLAWREGFCLIHQRYNNPADVDYRPNGEAVKRV